MAPADRWRKDRGETGARSEGDWRRGYGSEFDVEGSGAPRAATLKEAAYRGLGPLGYRRSDERMARH